MPPSPKLNYVRGVVICHGKSELQVARYISTNLRLGIKTYAKDNGKHSIQITSLMDVLNAAPFKDPTAFTKEYPVEETGKGKNRRFPDFRLFIIMDTDDCTDEQREHFKDGSMFSGHWLSPYIVPIYDSPNLEEVLWKSGVIEKKPDKGNKATTYEKVFPINKKELSVDTISQVNYLKKCLTGNTHTNLPEYIDYCLSLLPK